MATLFSIITGGCGLGWVWCSTSCPLLEGVDLDLENVAGITSRRWGRLETYGGKLVENIVQAIILDHRELTEYAVHSVSHRSQLWIVVQFGLDVVDAAEHPRVMSRVVTQDI